MSEEKNNLNTANGSDFRRPPRGGPPRIAMVGCGAIAECYHLPGLASIPGVIENVVLVDRNSERTRLMADKFGCHHQATNIADVAGEIDGAIVAVPPALHHPIGMSLIEQQIPVFCEKPLSESPTEAHEMVARAKARNVALCVNHTRRLLPAYAEVKRLIAAGEIGEVVDVSWEEGFEFNWPAASAFHFRGGGKGALADTGIHSLDLICWWLGSQPSVVSSQNDSFGGPESLVELMLRTNHCRIRLKLSWLSRLANRYSVVGERGTIAGTLDHWDQVTVTKPNGRQKSYRVKHVERNYNEFGRTLIQNFFDVVAGRVAPIVPAESVLPAIDVMNECYETATRLDMPWLDYQEAVCYAST